MLKEIRVKVREDLHRKVKAQAAIEGKNIKSVVVMCLERWLKEKGIEVE